MGKNCHAFTAMERSEETKINKKPKKPQTKKINKNPNHKQELTNVSSVRNY